MRQFLQPFLVTRNLIYNSICKMSTTHIERTADSSREDVFSKAIVTDIYQLSPTVKGFTLHVTNRKLKFFAGQWIDLHIPDEIDIVGGYSIASPPHQLYDPKKHTIELAIKHNNHPPALWMTTKCRIGDKVTLRVGGDFHYSPAHKELTDLLLIGGGVGINPLFSMLCHHIRLLSDSKTVGKGSVQLLYSSETDSELLFRDRIKHILSETDKVKVQYFVTKSSGTTSSDSTIKRHRIGDTDVINALKELDRSGVHCYLCGPPPMTEAMMEILLTQCKLRNNQIHYEKWW